jgi:spore germination protein YaaH
MKGLLKKIFAIIIVLLVAISMVLSMLPLPASASELQVSGWIPYWKAKEGARDAKKNISKLDVIHPFAFSIKENGSLKDLAKLSGRDWKSLFTLARSQDVLVVPTIMTSNTELVYSILSNPTLRERHIEDILKVVRKGKYDGIDIDYEGKSAATKDYYSLFLKELKKELGSKMLSCTIEARTPPDSLYRTPPETIRYANDFDAINEHCDRVNIMAYDQQRADLKLNDARKGAPYIPVADVEWVEKVMELTLESIDKDKLVLGVPTYGAEWELQVAPEWYKQYSKLWALNPVYAEDTQKSEKVKAVRNSAGELSFTYLPKGISIPKAYKAPRGTPEAYEAAERALSYASATGNTTLVNVVWWSDAKAIEDKVELAKKLGIRGVAIFKIDGGEDKDIWKLF